MVHFPTREKNTLDLILTTLPGQFQDVHSPDKLSDHDIVSGTLKIFDPPPHKEISEKDVSIYLYQNGDYESMRKGTLEFAKEKYRGSTVGFLLLQCSSGVVRHPRDLQVSVATHFCRVLIFASS